MIHRSRFFLTSTSITAIAVALAGLLMPAARASEPREENVASQIHAVLDAQVTSWNRGDIDAFMEGYERSPATEFVSGDKLTRGWQIVRDRYKKKYNSREKMGALTFSELVVRPLGAEAALVTGRWKLIRQGDQPHGRFTLLFRRTESGWRIVHDHTS